MSSSNFIALNIDNDIIHFIEFEDKRNKKIIKKIGERKLPKNSCQSAYNIFNVEVVSSELKLLIKEFKIEAKRALYLLPEKSILKKKILLPLSSTEKEVYNRIKTRARNIIGEDFDDIYFDFYTEENHADRNLEVYITSTRKNVIDERDLVITKAGLEPLIADIPSFSFARTNHLIREQFTKENKTKLNDDTFLIYIIKEEKSVKTFFYSNSNEIFEAEHPITNNDNDIVNEVIKEALFIVKENNIEANLGGFALFNLESIINDTSIVKSPFIHINPFYKSVLKTNKEIKGSYEWLALAGMTHRQTTDY